jgi:hypothetical protein
MASKPQPLSLVYCKEIQPAALRHQQLGINTISSQCQDQPVLWTRAMCNFTAGLVLVHDFASGAPEYLHK